MLKLARRLLLIAIALTALLTGWAALRATAIPLAALERGAPRRTALMLERERQARGAGHPYHVDQRWVPYGAISPTLRRAILIAEDDKFYTHDGLDWDEIGAAARTDIVKRRAARGGSTITQQLAKNLYLGDSKNPIRKLEEAFLAVRLEHQLSKRRIFELYLNLIEWGDGVFGAEAASRRYFGVSARALDPRQSLLLASVIINPRRFSVLHPGKRIERRVRIVASRMRRRGYLDAGQYALAVGKAPPPSPSFLDWFFGGPSPARSTPDTGARPRAASPESAASDSSAARPDSQPVR
jgi:monofunctional biosynthetic peptidoglycan transglycosylase